MKSLPVIWQRLVNADRKTCDRCDATHHEIENAVGKLREALRPLGMEPTLETREISEASFKANPAESNRIWIAGKPLEEWLGASVGSSQCCSACGDSHCRTVEVEGAVFETVPATLLIKAGLIAAAQLSGPTTETTACEATSCCCSR